MSRHKPPFTLETAQEKVKAAQASWNTRYVLSLPQRFPARLPQSPRLLVRSTKPSANPGPPFLHSYLLIETRTLSKTVTLRTASGATATNSWTGTPPLSRSSRPNGRGNTTIDCAKSSSRSGTIRSPCSSGTSIKTGRTR